jgi:hydroxymethylbilane synthase
LIMARSGLERLRLTSRIAYEFSIAEMLPAVGQGIVAVECAARDFETRRILSAIDDATTHACANAEREVLWVLNGHCNSPIAGFAEVMGTEMQLAASVLDHAGGRIIEASRVGRASRPRELGRAVGMELLARGAAEIIERGRPV